MSSPSSETSTADRKQEVSSDKQRQLPLPLPFIGNSRKKKRAELPERLSATLSSPWTSLDNCEQAMPAATGDAAATFLLLRPTFFLSSLALAYSQGNGVAGKSGLAACNAAYAQHASSRQAGDTVGQLLRRVLIHATANLMC